MENLRRELVDYRNGRDPGRLLRLCRRTLRSIPASSVQAERDFSIVRHLLGENRARQKTQTLDDIFILNRANADLLHCG